MSNNPVRLTVCMRNGGLFFCSGCMELIVFFFDIAKAII